MAAVARPQAVGGNTGMKAALIAFVCLTVASLGGLIFLYTYQTDLTNREKSAQDSATRAQDEARQAKGQLSTFANRMIGEATDDPARIQQAIATALGAIQKDPRLEKDIPKDAAALTALQELYRQYSATADQLAQVTADRDKLNKDLAALNQASEAAQKAFAERVDQLQAQYQKLEQEATAARDAWTKDVADLNRKLAAATDTASQHLSRERQAVQNLEQQLTQRDTRIQELRETLASFRPSADQYSAIQIADGSIVRTVPGQGLAYISLGARDRVKPGMSFAVYSRVRGIPTDGKGKASLEVTHVFDTTSECKVLSTTPSDPIVEGDIVANPVFDRSRQFHFAVAGDFDLDFDGVPEDRGGQQVIRMIENWGGKVVKQVDTRTDFVVLGTSPTLAVRTRGPQETSATEHAAEQDAARTSFEALKQEARALSIPVLTRTQFLHFVGKPVPRNATDEKAM